MVCGGMEGLGEFDLSFNNFTGTVPAELGNSPK